MQQIEMRWQVLYIVLRMAFGHQPQNSAEGT